MSARKVPLGLTALSAALIAVSVLLAHRVATARLVASPLAATPGGPDFPICEGQDAEACDEQHPAAAYNPTVDEYLVVFQWDLAGASDHDIMALRVAADGTVVGSPFCVACGTDDAEEPALTWNGKRNEYLVVWQRRVGSGGFDVYGKVIVHTSGAGTELSIAEHAGDQLHPRVGYTGGPRYYLVVWEDLDPVMLPDPPDVFGRCVTENGTLLGIELAIAREDDDQYRPSVATNGFNDDWLVTWTDTRSGGADLYGRRVDSVKPCGLLGSAFAVGAGPGEAGYSAVEWGQVGATSDGEFLTVWPEGPTMLAQRVDGQLYTPLGQPITLTHSSGVGTFPAVSFAGQQQEWWVVWEELTGTEATFIYGQRILPEGTVPSEGLEQRVSQDPASLPPSLQQERPAMAYNTTPITTTAQALVAWGDHGHYDLSDAGYWGLWGRMWVPANLARAAFVPLVLRGY